MFTKNYYTALLARSSTGGVARATLKATSGTNVSTRVKDITSASYSVNFDDFMLQQYPYDDVAQLFVISNNTNIFYNNTSSASNPTLYGVIIGDGDTAESIDDYKLSGNQITSFSATTSVNASVTDNGLLYIATYNITNTGSSDIVIKEIGLCGAFGKDGSSSISARVMLERTVLKNPLTIGTGETKTLVYRITFGTPVAEAN